MDNEIVSFTTREPRQGEVEGVDYQFISQEKFDELYNSNGLAEHTTYYGSASYGITMEELTSKLAKGDAFVIVDVVGKRQLEELWDNTTSIFVFQPYPKIAIKRMELRGDSKEAIKKRLVTYEEEIANFPEYDVLLYNVGQIESAISGFEKLVSNKFFARGNPK
jgi:guanylate kinase